MRVYTACDYAQNAGRSKFSLILGHRPPRTELTFKLFAMDTLALLSSGGHRRGHTYTHTTSASVRRAESGVNSRVPHGVLLHVADQSRLSPTRHSLSCTPFCSPRQACAGVWLPAAPESENHQTLRKRLRPSAPAQPCGGRTLSPSPGPGRKGPASPPPQDPRRGGPLASSQHSPWVSIRCTSLASASLRCSTGSSHHRSCRLHFIAADPGPGSSHPSCLGPVQPSRRRCGSDTVRRLTWKYYFQGNNS